MAFFKQQLMYLEMAEATGSSSAKGGKSRNSTQSRQIEAIKQKMEQHRNDTKVRIVQENRLKPNLPLQQLTKRYRTQISRRQQSHSSARRKSSKPKSPTSKSASSGRPNWKPAKRN